MKEDINKRIRGDIVKKQMNTSSVPSANAKNNYKIKILSPNFTQVPASALE